MRDRLRKFLASDASRSASPARVSPPPTQQTSSASPCLPPSTLSNIGAHAPAPIASRNLALEEALAVHLQKLPEAEKVAFVQSCNSVDEQTLLSSVQTYDLAHKDRSSFRPHAERLSKFLDLLNRFMGGVAIGIQANPELSSIVVGSVRIAIDLALKSVTFFSRLTDMVCTFQDYLGPLAQYAQAADVELVQKAVVNVYLNVLDFGRKARRVFVDANGEQRRWASIRTFIRQQWETFESEFVSIREDMQHHLDVLLHSVQALHFDTFRKTEQTRQREDESRCSLFNGIWLCHLLTVWQGNKRRHFSLGFRTSTSNKSIRTLTRRSMTKHVTG
jgi:hypothetical protein